MVYRMTLSNAATLIGPYARHNEAYRMPTSVEYVGRKWSHGSQYRSGSAALVDLRREE